MSNGAVDNPLPSMDDTVALYLAESNCDYPWIVQGCPPSPPPPTPCQSIPICQSICDHPWIVHECPPLSPPIVRVSADARVTVDPVDPGEACPGPSGNITQYQISFHTGSVVATENVSIAGCTAGRCSHTFEPPSNPHSSYDSVSVAAENVVGVRAARTCTRQTISELLVAS